MEGDELICNKLKSTDRVRQKLEGAKSHINNNKGTKISIEPSKYIDILG